MSENRHLHSVGEIARMLDARALDLCQDLLRGGRRQGREWVAKDFSGAPGTELSVCIAGEKQGVWKQFNSAAPMHGDMLEFVRMAVCGGDKVAAIRWAKAWLGIDGGDADALARTRQAVALQKRDPGPDRSARQKREKAYRTLNGSARFAGSMAELYLRGRGIDFSRLTGRITALRCHPGLGYWIGGDKPQLLGTWPAMVAPIFDFEGRFKAIHRTWLAPRADGSVGKAPVPDAKKVQGLMRGGFIPLWRGTRVDPATGEVKPGLPLRDAGGDVVIDITEGIEDGGSVAMHCEDARVVVGISLSNMGCIDWPENVSTVNFWRQNDKQGGPAEMAADAVVQAWQRQGKRVRLCRPPPQFKDVNDWLQASAREKSA
ncbi:DUF7146 domain-containing protein [Ferrovibrio sp.]|uniref:DUF7146 domain-containing protein n=1 Tax=Ferrovibrio sp. TaxID=1917215 RepID=UPI003D0A7220